MGVLWQKVESSATSPEHEIPGGALACVVGSRVYLVGGLTSRKNDPDIALRMFTWSSPGCPIGNEGKQNGERENPELGTAIPTLASMCASQEGNIPVVRIGHAAVVNSSGTAIFLFGGETHSTTTVRSSSKLSDVYEGTPKEPSGTLVWRALIDPGPMVTSADDEANPVGGKVSSPDAPAPTAFHAACACLVRGEWAMVVHGGLSQSSELLTDLWAFRLRRTEGSNAPDPPPTADFSWERLLPEGVGPPPAAYHSATPVNNGKMAVFVGGGDWASSVYLLDAVGLKWSCIEVAGVPERCLQSAVSVTVVEAGSTPAENGDNGEDVSSSPPAPDVSPPKDEAAAPAIQLWDPVGEPSEIIGHGKTITEAGNRGDGPAGEGDGKCHAAPLFESIFIFGGIDGAAISGDTVVLRADGTVAPLSIDRRSSPPPDPRYNHAMASVHGRKQVLMFGGCCGDGTRLQDVFLLDLTDSTEDGGETDDDKEGGDGKDDDQVDISVTFEGGDVYTGQLDADGRRQGSGRCEYAAGGISGGGSYGGQWDADQPHGSGVRLYPTGGGHKNDAADGAFGLGCPPMVSYKGDWKRGASDGNGTCTFAAVSSGERASAKTRLISLAGGNGNGGMRGVPDAIPISYSGEWVNGRPFGKGTLHLRTAEASSVKARPGALGTSCGSDGWIEGVWTHEGLMYGKGKLPGKKSMYEGQYHLGKREGHGRLDLPNGSEYEGAWKNGRQNGIGTFRCGVTRHVYTGKWVGGVRCGKGVCEYASGSRYEGLWLDGVRQGKGVLTSSSGDTLVGLWQGDEYVAAPITVADERTSITSSGGGTPRRNLVT